MSETHNHEPYKIPPRGSLQENDSKLASSNYNSSNKSNSSISFGQQKFAEIIFDDGNNTTYKSVPIPQSGYPVFDPKRLKFKEMREIAWNNHTSTVYNLKFYNKQTQHENSRVFYRQAVFMKDFEDDYTEIHPFSSYYPYYQLMTYEQLRTYFTWRTKVRKGIIEETYLSYAFVYVYELLNNIGVQDPADSLNKLILFRKAIRGYDSAIDKYIIRWIKDYHIYYQLADTFKDFIYEHNLEGYYPEVLDFDQEQSFSFENLSTLSKYNIKQSAFYIEKSSLVHECFDFVINRIKNLFADNGIDLYKLIFQPSSKKAIWTPFKGALFYPTLKQPDKKIVLSNEEVYICNNNIWYLSTLITSDGGKQLISYILKQLEAVLRKATGYKYKLSASLNLINNDLLQMLNDKGISLEKVVTDTVMEFYREKTKTVVSVDLSSLNRIRLEAQFTQEKLIVPENETQILPVLKSSSPDVLNATHAYSSGLPQDLKHVDTSTLSKNLTHADTPTLPTDLTHTVTLPKDLANANTPLLSDDFKHPASNISNHLAVVNNSTLSDDITKVASSSSSDFKQLNLFDITNFTDIGVAAEPDLKATNSEVQLSSKPIVISTVPSVVPAATSTLSGGWTGFRQALTEVELKALSVILHNSQDIKQFADSHGIMLEVLTDSINEKAFDHIGDSILELDDSVIIYDEYLENIKAMVIEI